MATALQSPSFSLGLLQPPIQVDWEKTLNRNFLLAKDTLRTGDATFFKNSRALSFASGIDFANVLKLHLPPDLIDTTKPEDIHKLNKTFILNVRDKVQAIRPDIEKSIRANKPQDELFAEIDNKIDDTKEQIDKDIEELRKELKLTIRRFPGKVAQHKAVDVWLESWNTVQEGVGRIMAALNDIVNAISKLVQQVWVWAQKAWKTVETVVKDVVEWIESLFD